MTVVENLATVLGGDIDGMPSEDTLADGLDVVRDGLDVVGVDDC